MCVNSFYLVFTGLFASVSLFFFYIVFVFSWTSEEGCGNVILELLSSDFVFLIFSVKFVIVAFS